MNSIKLLITIQIYIIILKENIIYLILLILLLGEIHQISNMKIGFFSMVLKIFVIDSEDY